MKSSYLDIMEKALSAYSAQRIEEYIDEVRSNGLTEHGFPRLGANIGILLAYGRRLDLMDVFIEIMDICCGEMPRKKAANNFSIREVCCCLMLLEERKVVCKELLQKWKQQISTFDPWKYYSFIDDGSGCIVEEPGKKVNNWALFAAVSEFVRGSYCGIDTLEFVEWQLPAQIESLDDADMYKDGDPHKNPTVYDLVVRILIAFLLRFGYNGRYKERLEAVLDHTADATLKMQSVTGEIAFGGRSNQFLHNEAMLCAYFELEAVRFKEKGKLEKAGEFKAAAELAEENLFYYLSFNPIHHVKNRYDLSSMIGCEPYGYFNKYMITLASNLYMGALFCDEEIPKGSLTNKEKPYIFSTTDEFNKTFIHAGGYFLEFDTDADFYYDANGLGRVQKKGCCPVICLAVPFPCDEEYKYKTEFPNPVPMSLCCKGGASVPYTLTESEVLADSVSAVFRCEKGKEKYTVSADGVKISYEHTSGFSLPVFEFDGEKNTEISVQANRITVSYQNSSCVYRFNGCITGHDRYCNRNGRYRVYQIDGNDLHIEIKDCVQ